MKKKNFKKVVFAAAIAAAAAAFSACSKGSSTAETTTAAGASTETAAETTAADDSLTADIIQKAIDAITAEKPDSIGTITLGDYKNISVTATKAKVITDEYVDDYINTNILPNVYDDVDVVADGCIANIDYVGKKDGVEFDGGTAQGYDLEIGSGTFIDGFESGLIGAKTGDTLDLNLTFPEDYGSTDLAGADVVFTVTVNSIKAPLEGPLTDEIVKKTSEEYDTAAAYKADVKKQLQSGADTAAEQEMYYQVLEAIKDASEIEVSDAGLEWAEDFLIKEYYAPVTKATYSAYGVELGDMLYYQGTDLDAFKDSIKDSAEYFVQQSLIVDAIADAEGISITDDDAKAYAEEMGSSLDELYALYGEEFVKFNTKEVTALKKAAEYANITWEDAPEETASEAGTEAAEETKAATAAEESSAADSAENEEAAAEAESESTAAGAANAADAKTTDTKAETKAAEAETTEASR